tara:strand:+ start:1494 stop:2027 length:534 start_codon:yes stop_codon:yes gene_type:complete
MKSKEHTATVAGRNLSISTKQAIAICNFIRGNSVKKSKEILSRVMEKKTAVPFTVNKRDMAHRKGKMAAGRYPQNATKEIINLLNSVESNANDKGLNTQTLRITSIIPNKASTPWHHGRLRRRKMKRTHIDIVVEENEPTKKEKGSKHKQTRKEVPKKEVQQVKQTEQKKENKEGKE